MFEALLPVLEKDGLVAITEVVDDFEGPIPPAVSFTPNAVPNRGVITEEELANEN